MKLRLLKAAKIRHEAGETVEVSPSQAQFLLSIRAAEIEKAEKPKKKKEK